MKIVYIIACLLVLTLVYGGFQLQRWWNYKFSYESKVIEEIHKNVKQECLIK